MPRKLLLSKGDRDKVVLSFSELGIWSEFKNHRTVELTSFSVMTKNEIESLLCKIQEKGEDLFKDNPECSTIVSNYIAHCHKRLEAINEVKKIKEERQAPKRDKTTNLVLITDSETEAYLKLALKAHWMVYNYFFDEVYAVNSIASTTKKYYDFPKASKRLTEMKKTPEYAFLNDIDSIVVQRGLLHVQSQWKYFWEECKLTNEENRGKNIAQPKKIDNQDNFYTSRTPGKTNVSYQSGYLKIPKCSAIRALLTDDKQREHPDTDLRGVKIELKDSLWYATLFYK